MGSTELSPDDVAAVVNAVLASTRRQWEPVSPDTPLHELDLESVEYVEVFVMLEERHGVRLDLSNLPHLTRVRDLCRLTSATPPAS